MMTMLYSNVGAVAELFDISCLYGTPSFDTIQDEALAAWQEAPEGFSTSDLISALQAGTLPHEIPLEVLGKSY